MKFKVVVLLIAFVTPLILAAQEPVDPLFTKLDQAFAQNGKLLPGDVYKFGWPRSDLHVTLDGIALAPALALGSWGAFQKTMSGELMTMGDLVLLPSELPAVIDALHQGDIDVLAVHNHLTGETPEVVYAHFEGHGTADSLAQALKNALSKTKTPMPPASKSASVSAADTSTFETIQKILGAKGTMAGSILQVGVPRKEKIQDNGMTIPPPMGMANSMNFQIAGSRVASTGDFVLIGSEVNPVISELRAHNIKITALHMHMLDDSPHLYFMHFWALDTGEKVAEGLKEALAKMNVAH
jgi:Domain of Unknown Function (DUF1259)